MTLRAHLAREDRGWPFERVAKYGPEITAAMKRLEAEYPKDVAVAPLMGEVVSGARQLWLVLDEDKDDAFVSFALTQIKTNDHTGHRMVWVTDLAGAGGIENCPLASDIEEFAREMGATEVVITGRLGWRKALAKEGYEANAMIYRKPLGDA